MEDLKQHQAHLIANDKRIVIKLPIQKKIQFIKERDSRQMSSSEFVIYLLKEYQGDHLSVIKNFRYNLNKRIKKGIDKHYLFELRRLRDQLNLIIDKY